MPKRVRSDSISFAVAAAQTKRLASPPAHVPLDVSELPFFESIAAEMAGTELTEHVAEIAAMLARTMCALEAEQRLLKSEGTVIANQRGTPIANPRVFACRGLTSDVQSLRRSLQLHARATNGEARDAAKRRQAGKAAENVLSFRDSLLAQPE